VPADHLAAEALIVARLQAQVPALTRVYGLGELAQLDEASQTVPSAHVIYQGESFEGEAGRGAKQKVLQTWLVVIAIDSAVDPVTGSGARASAGSLMSQVITALAGYELATGFRPCKRVNAPAPAYAGQFAYFPLAFEVGFIGG